MTNNDQRRARNVRHLVATMIGTVLLAHGVAQAEDLRPSQGGSVRIGRVEGIAYCTGDSGAGRWRAVVTLVPVDVETTPMRVEVSLEPEQSMRLSVPSWDGQRADAFTLTRHGDRLAIDQDEVRTLAANQ